MTPAAIENTGWKIYILFCIMLFLSIPIVYFFLPEASSSQLLYRLHTVNMSQTANKSLEEIDLIFVTEEEKADMELNLAHSTRDAARVDEFKNTVGEQEQAENT